MLSIDHPLVVFSVGLSYIDNSSYAVPSQFLNAKKWQWFLILKNNSYAHFLESTTFQGQQLLPKKRGSKQATTTDHRDEELPWPHATESWPDLHQPYTTPTILRFSNLRSVTEQPKPSSEGYLQPAMKSSAEVTDSVSLCISGEIVTWVIPYPVKHCCMYRSVISHCLNDVPARIRTWRDARTILKPTEISVLVWSAEKGWQLAIVKDSTHERRESKGPLEAEVGEYHLRMSWRKWWQENRHLRMWDLPSPLLNPGAGVLPPRECGPFLELEEAMSIQAQWNKFWLTCWYGSPKDDEADDERGDGIGVKAIWWV